MRPYEQVGTQRQPGTGRGHPQRKPRGGMSDTQQAGGGALRAPSWLLLEGAPCLAGAGDPLKAWEVGTLASRAASGCPPPPSSQGSPADPCCSPSACKSTTQTGHRLVIHLAEQSQVTQGTLRGQPEPPLFIKWQRKGTEPQNSYSRLPACQQLCSDPRGRARTPKHNTVIVLSLGKGGVAVYGPTRESHNRPGLPSCNYVTEACAEHVPPTWPRGREKHGSSGASAPRPPGDRGAEDAVGSSTETPRSKPRLRYCPPVSKGQGRRGRSCTEQHEEAKQAPARHLPATQGEVGGDSASLRTAGNTR